jgi:hypothetical protein
MDPTDASPAPEPEENAARTRRGRHHRRDRRKPRRQNLAQAGVIAIVFGLLLTVSFVLLAKSCERDEPPSSEPAAG